MADDVLLYTNNASSTMSGTLSNGGTTLVLAASTGSEFPAPTTGEAFYATIYELDGSSVEEYVEVVKVSGRTADTLTLAERDVGGLVAAAGGPGSGGYAYPSAPAKPVYIELRWTAESANDVLTAARLYAAGTEDAVADTDTFNYLDTSAGDALVKTTWSNIKAKLWAAWGALITAGTAKTTPVDADEIALSDSAASNATKKLSLSNLWTNLFKGKADALYATTGHNHSGVYQPADANLPTWPAAVSATEVGYLDGVTSAIQTQLDARAKKSADADLEMNDYKIHEIKTATFNSEATVTQSTGTLTVDWRTAQNIKVTPSQAITTMTFSNAPPGPCHLQMRFTTGAYAITYPTSNFYWLGGGAPTLTSGKSTIVNMWYDGTDYWAMGATQV